MGTASKASRQPSRGKLSVTAPLTVSADKKGRSNIKNTTIKAIGNEIGRFRKDVAQRDLELDKLLSLTSEIRLRLG